MGKTEKYGYYAIKYKITTKLVVDWEEFFADNNVIITTDKLNILDLWLYLNLKYRVGSTFINSDWIEETVTSVISEYID